MKKLFILIFSLMSLTIIGQELVSNQSNQQIEEDINWGELAPLERALTQEELQEYLSNWKALHSLSLSEYLGAFQSFVENSLPFYELQPYLLAECLWFQVSILPQFQQVERDGSLDEMMDLNMVVLPDIQSSISDFFTGLGEGSLPIHPWSDTVLSIFQHLVSNPPAAKFFSQSNLQETLLVGENIPSLPALSVDHIFMPVDYSYRSVQLYRGIMDFEALLEQFESVDESGLSYEPEQEGLPEDSLEPPPMPEIDWEKVVSNQPLMYLMTHSDEGKDIYGVLREYHSGQTRASLCEDLYLESCKIGEQWGFSLEEILPTFSATAVKTAKEDLFILYCLPEHDLEQIASDLTCMKELVPIYFSKTVDLLYRNGGVL